METETQDRGEYTSASNAAADAKCQGRFLAQRGLPEIPRPDAEHGRAIHDALAKQDPTGLTVDQLDIYDSCCAIEKKVVMQYFGIDEEQFKTRRSFREQRFWIHWKDELKHSGQPDCADRLGVKALIIEYKTLAGDVAGSPENRQVRDQVCLFDHNNPMLSEIAAVVIQPLHTHSPRLTIYNRDHIKLAMKEMHDRVAASNNTNAPRTPGEFQCNYCKAAQAGKCKEYNAWAGALTTTPAISSILDTPCANWSPDQCVLFLARLSIAQKWLDECKASMKARLKANPEAIPGWSLKDGDKRTTIINPQSVFDRFSQIGGSITQFMEIVGIGKGDLKKAIASVTKAKGKTLEKELEAVIGKDFTEKQCEPELARKK